MLKAYQQLEDSAKRTNLLDSLSADLNRFARESNLVQRKSNSFDPESFLLTLIDCVNTGKGSLNEIATAYAKQANGSNLSPQAIHERITREETSLECFLCRCISHTIAGKFRSNAELRTISNTKFNRILVEDSSFVKLLKSCADIFKAHGNAHGKTAGMKLDLCFDLLTGDPIEASLHSGTTQDRSIGWDVLDYLQPSDLVLRDMGYFDVSLFSSIEKMLAYWLSRLTSSALVTLEEIDDKTGETSTTRPLEDLLKSTDLNQLDLTCYVTAEGHKCRLVATRASAEETAKQRRELRSKAKKNGKTPSQQSLLRAGWHIMITNIESEKLEVEKLNSIYRQRWQIEIIFRGWKQSSLMSESLRRKSSAQHLIAFMLTSILILLLTMKLAAELRRQNITLSQRLSIEKLAIWMSQQLSHIKHLKAIYHLQPDIRHIITQKRKRKSQIQKLIDLLA